MLKKDKIYFSNKIKKILFLWLFLVQNVFSQNISNHTFAIAEFSDKEHIESILQENVAEGSFGMSIEVFEDPETYALKLKLKQGDLNLKTFFELLSTSINKDQVFPLFIKYGGKDEKLIDVLKLTNLLNISFYQPIGERWPTIKEITAQKKPLVIFKVGSIHSPINNTSNHILDFSTFNTINENNLDKILGNEFLTIKHFTEYNLLNNEIPENWDRISVNPYSIEYLMHAWKVTGKRPNFIFYSSFKHKGTLYFLTKILNETPFIAGEVSNETNIIKGINWEHAITSLTGGYYNFPYEKGETFVLKPLKEGYRFVPTSFNIYDETILDENFNFKAEKLDITEGLTAVYKFDDNLDNAIKQEKLNANNPKFINDKDRGTVLKIDSKNYIKLEAVEHYKIVNSSFTMAVDVKYLSNDKQINYCILGSDEQGFRKGLHVNISYGNLVFGFYTNDSRSEHFVAPTKWHRLVVKYNIDTQKQSIHMDGEKIGEASNRPSFIGTANLLLGHGIKQNNYFTGYLNNLQIWNRALSGEEIKWLANNPLVLKEKTSTNNTIILLSIISFCLLMVLFWVIVRLKRTKKRKIPFSVLESDTQIKNAIYLFGKFSLIDGHGVDIASELSPKIKELFLLILLRTMKTKRGIATAELTDLLWNGFLPAKAANNRGVSFNALKKTLKRIEGIDVVYENKFWKAKLAKGVYFDYAWVLKFIKLKETNYQQFFDTVKRGQFLSGAKIDWLLEERSNLDFDILDTLLLYCKEQYYEENFKTVLQVTSYVQTIDELNIQALYYQLHCLSKEGSKNKMVFLFDNFCQKYEAINAVKFKYHLKPFLQENPENIWE